MAKDKFDELIERAKQDSKDDFLRFVKDIYGVDESIFDNIWEVPVIASWEGDTLVNTPLSTKTEEELIDIVDEFIDKQLGNADACFISLDKLAVEFTVEELEEWQKKLDSGELKLDYNAIIIYNERELQKFYKELSNNKSKTQEELDQIFVNYVKSVITHERCHLNANSLVVEVRDNKFVSEEINGSETSSWEIDDSILIEKRKNRVDQSGYLEEDEFVFDPLALMKRYESRNEVLVDTLSQMMSDYKEGDSIEDCLFRIIDYRKGKSQYKDIDDREVLTMYTLFPEELTEWATFGAYDFIRENKLQKMIIDVCGTDRPFYFNEFKKKVEKYVTTLKEDSLSKRQIEMLKMLGFSINRKIDKEDIKEVAISEEALEALRGSLLDIQVFMQNMRKEAPNIEIQ